MTLTYEQLRELASDLKFQKALENTIELHVYYAHRDEVSDELAEEAFDAMGELFRRVTTVKVGYNTSYFKKRFQPFQRMLNRWKSTAEFCLGLRLLEPYPEVDFENICYINIDGMKVRELYLRRRCDDNEDMEPILPLSGTNDKAPIKWMDLPSRCPKLVTLSVDADVNWFQSHWIPDTVRYIHLTNLYGDFFSSSPVFKIPRRTESLYITDNEMSPVRELPDLGDAEEGDEITSVLPWVDLTNAAGLKKFNYKGPQFTNRIFQAILKVRKSLRHLTVVCGDAMPGSLLMFREWITGAFDLKQLQVYLCISRKEPWGRGINCDFLFDLGYRVAYDSRTSKYLTKDYSDDSIEDDYDDGYISLSLG